MPRIIKKDLFTKDMWDKTKHYASFENQKGEQYVGPFNSMGEAHTWLEQTKASNPNMQDDFFVLSHEDIVLTIEKNKFKILSSQTPNPQLSAGLDPKVIQQAFDKIVSTIDSSKDMIASADERISKSQSDLNNVIEKMRGQIQGNQPPKGKNQIDKGVKF